MVKYGLLDSFQPQEAVLVFTDNRLGSSGLSGFCLSWLRLRKSHLPWLRYRFLKSKLQPSSYAAQYVFLD